MIFARPLQIARSLKRAVLIALACACPAVLIAQLADDAVDTATDAAVGFDAEQLLGTWRTETESGVRVIMIKDRQRASYFWSDNSDLTVTQGTWSATGQGLRIDWPDGTRHVVSPQPSGFVFEHRTADGSLIAQASALRLPDEIVGQWATAPDRETEGESTLDEAEGFFGVWEVGSGDRVEYVFVESDRSAASTWAGSTLRERGLRGSWAKQGSELHIAWDTGHYTVLREMLRGYEMLRHEPGVRLSGDEGVAFPARRVRRDTAPNGWLLAYEEERENATGGIAFTNRNSAIRFYRGDWVVQTNSEQFERIEIGRFGGLATSKDSTLGGEWLMSGQDLFLRWDNGLREILSPVAYGFLVYEYEPGRPLDGVPTRVRPAVPDDPAKLEEHLAARKEVAEKMIALAATAGVNESIRNEGWGSTFMRWAWPFDDDVQTGTGALLEEEYEAVARSEQDPWWWPFWSEREVAAAGNRAAEEAAVATAQRSNAERERDDQSDAGSGKRGTAPENRTWNWPF